MPDELRDSIRTASEETHLSQQDIIRQSIRAGLPLVRARFSPPKPRLLSAWDALNCGRGIEMEFPRMAGQVKKVEL